MVSRGEKRKFNELCVHRQKEVTYLGIVRLCHSATLSDVFSSPGTWHKWAGTTIWNINKFVYVIGEVNSKLFRKHDFEAAVIICNACIKLRHTNILKREVTDHKSDEEGNWHKDEDKHFLLVPAI